MRRAKPYSYMAGRSAVFHNFVRRSTVSGPVVCEVLNFFERWRTSQEAIRRFARITRRRVCVPLSLSWWDAGLLLRKGSPGRSEARTCGSHRSGRLGCPRGRLSVFSTKDVAATLIGATGSLDRLRGCAAERRREPENLQKRPLNGGNEATAADACDFPDSRFVRDLDEARRTHRRFSRRARP